MAIIAAVTVGGFIIACVAGISWLALRLFFLALGRALAPSFGRERDVTEFRR